MGAAGFGGEKILLGGKIALDSLGARPGGEARPAFNGQIRNGEGGGGGLDRGHAALLLFEKARGKDLSNLVKERILTGGFLFIVGLFALVIFQDIWKLRH